MTHEELRAQEKTLLYLLDVARKDGAAVWAALLCEIIGTVKRDQKSSWSMGALLKEFLELDAIVNHESISCWGCGSAPDGPCDRGCILERTRQALAEVGK